MKAQIATTLVMLAAFSASAFATGGGNIGSSNLTEIECSVYDTRPGADESKNGTQTISVSPTQRSRTQLAEGVILNNMPASTIDEEPLPSGSGRLMVEIYEKVGGVNVGPMLFEGTQERVSVSLLTSPHSGQRVSVECKVTK